MNIISALIDGFTDFLERNRIEKDLDKIRISAFLYGRTREEGQKVIDRLTKTNKEDLSKFSLLSFDEQKIYLQCIDASWVYELAASPAGIGKTSFCQMPPNLQMIVLNSDCLKYAPDPLRLLRNNDWNNVLSTSNFTALTPDVQEAFVKHLCVQKEQGHQAVVNLLKHEMSTNRLSMKIKKTCFSQILKSSPQPTNVFDLIFVLQEKPYISSIYDALPEPLQSEVVDQIYQVLKTNPQELYTGKNWKEYLGQTKKKPLCAVYPTMSDVLDTISVAGPTPEIKKMIEKQDLALEQETLPQTRTPQIVHEANDVAHLLINNIKENVFGI